MYRCILQNNDGRSLIFETDTEMEFWTASEWLASRGFLAEGRVTFEQPAVLESIVDALPETQFLAVNRTGSFALLTRRSNAKRKRTILNRILRKSYADRWQASTKEARASVSNGRCAVYKKVRVEGGYSYYWEPLYGDPVLLGVRLDASKEYARNVSMPPVRGEVPIRGTIRQEYDLSCYLCDGKLSLKARRAGGIFYGCSNYATMGCRGSANALSSGIPDMHQYEENRRTAVASI